MKKVKSRFFNLDYLVGIKKSDEIEEKDDIKINDINEKEKQKKN